ncbi:hypothetical protein [Angustibacter luteus]|uniref:Transposase n=1 Tax=Angustibacter luteus TaxID=658456 RepID=A0ABW1JAU3_9ACTN
MSHDTAMETAGDDLAIRKELHGWFGDPWRSADCYDDEGQLLTALQIDVPVGQECLGCGEAFVAGDSGTAIPVLTASGAELHYEHRECALRQQVGSLAHLEGRCACRGGTAGDEGRSRRAEALLVWAWVADHGVPEAAAS